MALFQYQQHVEPLFTGGQAPPAAPDVSSWLPVDDTAPRRAPALAVAILSAALFAPPQQPAPTAPPSSSWEASYPDQVPARRPVAREGLHVEPVLPPAPELSWAPELPDLLRALRWPTSDGSVGPIEPVTAPPPPAPELSWAPDFPDAVRRPLAALPLGHTAGRVDPPAAPPAAPPLSWEPSFPDMALRAPGALPLGAVGGRVEPPPAAPAAPLLSWSPDYPDFARGHAPRPHGGPVYVPAASRWGLDALPWLPAFPGPSERVWPAQLEQHVEPVAPVSAPWSSLWYPSFPDRFPARALPRLGATSGKVDPPAPPPPPPDLYGVQLPDMVRRVARGPWGFTLVAPVLPAIPTVGGCALDHDGSTVAELGSDGSTVARLLNDVGGTMNRFFLTQGNTTPVLEATLYGPKKNARGERIPIAIPADSTVRLRMRKVDSTGAYKVDALGTVVAPGVAEGHADAGKVRYAWATADVDTAGDYIARFVTVDANGKEQDVPNNDTIFVTIGKAL